MRRLLVAFSAISVMTVANPGLAAGVPNPSHTKVPQQKGVNTRYTGKMIHIPAGSFLMGRSDVGDDKEYQIPNERPVHEVKLSDYSIGKYEVTRGEYRRFILAGGYTNRAYWSVDGWAWRVKSKRTRPLYWNATQNWDYEWNKRRVYRFTQTDNYPVVGVSYYEAEAFGNWAGGHLPTEAQWEKAARWNARTSHPNVYPWGDAWDAEKCNNCYDHNKAGGGYNKFQTAPVGSYPAGASPYGCQDMAGNVAEWCKDWYSGRYYSATPPDGWVNPQGPPRGNGRVMRGGSWFANYGDVCRCAGRSGPANSGIEPRVVAEYIGFRLAR